MERKNLFLFKILAILCFIFFVLFVEFLIYLVITYYKYTVTIYPVVAYIAAGAFISLSAWSLYLHRNKIVHKFTKTEFMKLFVPILALIALIVLSISITKPGMSKVEILSRPGVVFAIFMAIITVTGFVITVSKLDQLQGRVTDYSVLIDRCLELAEKEVDRATKLKKLGKLIIFANAPAFGNISAQKEFIPYKREIFNLLDNRTVKVVLGCLSPYIENGNTESALDNFYKSHFPNQPDINTKINESIEFINSLINRENKEAYALKSHIIEVPFHLIMSSTSAILFISLRFPSQSLDNSDFSPKSAKIIAYQTDNDSIMAAYEKAVMARLTNEEYAFKMEDIIPNRV